jgi:hypothetical protein
LFEKKEKIASTTCFLAAPQPRFSSKYHLHTFLPKFVCNESTEKRTKTRETHENVGQKKVERNRKSAASIFDCVSTSVHIPPFSVSSEDSVLCGICLQFLGNHLLIRLNLISSSFCRWPRCCPKMTMIFRPLLNHRIDPRRHVKSFISCPGD